jgi:hypothetical protein
MKIRTLLILIKPLFGSLSPQNRSYIIKSADMLYENFQLGLKQRFITSEYWQHFVLFSIFISSLATSSSIDE